MEAGEVDAGFGYQCSEAGDDVYGRTNAASAWMRKSGEIQWLEDDVGRAITPRVLEGVSDLTVFGQ